MAFVYVHELAGVADEIAEEKYETLSNYNAPFNLMTAACDRCNRDECIVSDIRREVVANAFFNRDCWVGKDIPDDDLDLVQAIVTETLQTARNINTRQIQIRSCDDRLLLLAVDQTIPRGQSSAHCIRAKPLPTFEEREQKIREVQPGVIMAIFAMAAMVVSVLFVISLLDLAASLIAGAGFIGIGLFYAAFLHRREPIPNVLTRHTLLL